MEWLPRSDSIYTVYSQRERHGKPTFPVMRETTPEDLTRLQQELSRADRGTVPRGLYIHIPFCDTICGFCLFDRVLFTDAKAARYLEALNSSLRDLAETPWAQSGPLTAVYLGGGTPTSLSAEQLGGLVNSIRKLFTVAPNGEFTIEGNPHNFSEVKLASVAAAGANRVSLGVQTFDKSLRTILGVPGTSDETLTSVLALRRSDLNLDIDLLYGIPGQTMDAWQQDLQTAIDLGVNSVSIYDVIMHPGTSLGRTAMQGIGPRPPDERQRIDFYLGAVETFLNHGYCQQHLYHFHRPGYENEYLKVRFGGNADCMGCGNTAAGRIDAFVFRNRVESHSWTEAVLARQATVTMVCPLSKEEALRDYVIKGLELLRLDRSKAVKAYGSDPAVRFHEVAQSLAARNLLTVSDGYMELTNLGKVWGWNVIKEFYPL